MERATSIKKAILENNGFVEFDIGCPGEKLDYFGIVAMGVNKYVVTLPKEKSTNSNKKHFFGDMWVIKMVNDKPTVTSKSLHTMSRFAVSIKGAVTGFNNRHRNAAYDRMEIVELVKV